MNQIIDNEMPIEEAINNLNRLRNPMDVGLSRLKIHIAIKMAIQALQSIATLENHIAETQSELESYEDGYWDECGCDWDSGYLAGLNKAREILTGEKNENG